MIFCTLFNKLYLPQGIALYRSLARTAGGDFTLFVLCLDELSAQALERLDLSNLRIVRLREIEDDALRAARDNRSVAEFCWTCTTPLLLHVQSLYPEGTVVTYVDADIRFFSDPKAILMELGQRAILIHEHDFAPEHASHIGAGRFNVGIAAFRNNAEGRMCLERWKAQCLDNCGIDYETGNCGDQRYLDEWPQLYPGLAIAEHPGIGLGPWNITKHRIEDDRGNVTVDGRPVVFYHYHGLRNLRPRFGVKPVFLANGNYVFAPEIIQAIYRPYVHELAEALDELRRLGFRIDQDFGTLSTMHSSTEGRQLLFSMAGMVCAPERNPQIISSLYGLDIIRDKLAHIWRRSAQRIQSLQ